MYECLCLVHSVAVKMQILPAFAKAAASVGGTLLTKTLHSAALKEVRYTKIEFLKRHSVIRVPKFLFMKALLLFYPI